MSEVMNSEWKAVREGDQISLYKAGNTEPSLVINIEQFKALKAIIEQV